ncbi:MAG: hypothetical protein C5B49_13515 [Bdellovibrio sp.]|nr:MAG: hypothetical protein C5B49_13515 [Bdellovibrio sp.]
MRTLCLSLHVERIHVDQIAEIFLALSPRVQSREPGFLFLDMESTAGLFGGEERSLARALDLARQVTSPISLTASTLPVPPMLPPPPTAAIADRPPLAQLLALYRPGQISPPGEDTKTLADFSLSALSALEGLKPWPRPRQIESIIHFLQNLGFESIHDLLGFPPASFRERWGETGITLWNRIHALEEQPISPLLPTEPFTHYGHFDFPVTQLRSLAAALAPALTFLFLRLESLGRFARRLELLLYCEYSDHRHAVHVEPVTPSRDRRLFEDLLLRKLDLLNLENPIRQFEIQLYDLPEKIQQLDFFEPRERSDERWQRLISFAQQGGVEMGFLEPLPKHFPEESYHLKADWPEILAVQDHIEHRDEAVQVKTVYGKNLAQAPRPTLLLRTPRKLSRGELRRYRKCSFIPLERIDARWWATVGGGIAKSADWAFRDYYLALSEEGSSVWIFQDRETKQYFLHGYFD